MVNRNAGHITEISADFRKLVLESLTMAKKSSDGLFNPFILPALQRSGYIGSWPSFELENKDLDFSPRRVCQANDLKLNKNKIEFPADCAMDFGGIGKGYLLDKISAIIESQGIHNYWLSFGGDLICNGDGEGDGWKIGVESAQAQSLPIDFLETDGQKMAIASSGVTKRKGLKNGQAWHHLTDSHTGLPAQTDILLATVVAETATLADIYAKSIVILGMAKSKVFIKKNKISRVILQTKNKLPIKIWRK
jgi:thiamine biosynthesis lipoprotein